MFEKYWANIIRYYTNKVPSPVTRRTRVRVRQSPAERECVWAIERETLPRALDSPPARKTRKIRCFKPTEVGFACVAEPVRCGEQRLAERSLSGGFLRSKLRGVPPVVATAGGSPGCSNWRATSSRLGK
jgi:hypothetical protein